jgi:hypothetical protein
VIGPLGYPLTETSIAKAVRILIVPTSSMEDKVQGPLPLELEQNLPVAFAARIKRPGIVNAMHDEGQQGRKGDRIQETMRGRLHHRNTRAFSGPPDAGRRIQGQVSADASASYTKYGDDIALRRMENAGAINTTMDQIVSELTIDWTSEWFKARRKSGVSLMSGHERTARGTAIAVCRDQEPLFQGRSLLRSGTVV